MATTTTLIEKTFDKITAHKTTESKRDPDLWRPGSAATEARCIFEMVGRNGDDVNSLRRLIGVSASEEAELREWAACAPPATAVGIEHMIRFRAAVLAEFETLVSRAG